VEGGAAFDVEFWVAFDKSEGHLSRNIFAKTLDEMRDRYGFSLVGYIVMADILLTSEPARSRRLFQRFLSQIHVGS